MRAARVVTGVLVEYRSYDFEDRWDVFVQSAIGQLLRDARRARGHDDAELQRIARQRLRGSLADAAGWKRDGELPWCEQRRVRERASGGLCEQVEYFQREIAKLPEQRSLVLRDVFGEGRNFDQVAAHRKIPLRMVKRFLRESIWDLRERGLARERREACKDDRVKSCLKSLELDLPAFLVEPQLEAWRDFRAHYPVCEDCSAVVSNWSQVEMLVRRACGGSDAHPTERDLIALHREGEGLAYTQYVALMQHLDSCPHCSEAMTLVSRFDGRPYEAALIRMADSARTVRRRRLQNWFGRLRAQFAP
ncbi:MAG: hypothetical protein QF570_09480 [Myxococcota bacterium]|nr:hypothetical protein [Myxococcota bacterium]